MTAYIFGDIDIHDPKAFEEYRAKVPAVITAHGGRYLVRGGAVETLEGDWTPRRTVILEFPDMDRLKAFWNSSDYRPLKALRQSASTARLVAIQGYQ